MRPSRIRFWSRLHTWSSLACTLFLLLLCFTGLPLIFHDEIGRVLRTEPEAEAPLVDSPYADLDRVVAAALAQRPGEVVQYLIWDDDAPGRVRLSLAPSPTAPAAALRTVLVDARTAAVLDDPRDTEGFLYWMLRLHTDLFAGTPGKLFLGAMALLFVLAFVSGAALYAPFTQRLPFGTVRWDRSPKTRRLDVHNLLGIATLCWALVVGATGAVNTLAEQVLAVWHADQLAAMAAPWHGQPPLTKPGPVQAAVSAALAAAPPGKTPYFVAWPQTPFTSGHHYAVFLRGETPLTRRLLTPALVDAETGRLTDLRPMPWYVGALFLSQPLHFGDYGGLPLKLVWAALDLATIAVLWGGLRLWWARRRPPVSATGSSVAG